MRDDFSKGKRLQVRGGKKRAHRSILTLDNLPKTNMKYILLIAQLKARYKADKEQDKGESNQKAEDFMVYQEIHPMPTEKKRFNLAEAKQIGDALGIDWLMFGVEQFQAGLEVELEHGARDLPTNLSNDDALITGKIALTHLKEFPDYYTHLLAMEKEADEYWANV